MIVIPMAGLSRRFREAGYDRPKYMLPLGGQTLFAHAVRSFEACFASEPFLFIARDEAGTPGFIDTELARLGVRDYRTVILPGPTAGQADTVRLGLASAGFPPEVPLTIFNIDTFRPGFRYPESAWMEEADGYLEVMTATDPGFSFVRPMAGDPSRVAETAEKVVISDLASTGLYWFREAGIFLDALQAEGEAARAHGELYVAPLYNALIRRGLDVRWHRVPNEAVIFCGTPAQYRHLLGSDSAAPSA